MKWILSPHLKAFFHGISAEDYMGGGSNENSGAGGDSNGDRKRKKKSRWATGPENEKTFIPGMPTILPSNLNPDQQEAYLGNYQYFSILQYINRKFTLSINHIYLNNVLNFCKINFLCYGSFKQKKIKKLIFNLMFK